MNNPIHIYYINLHQINALQSGQSIRKQENIMSTYFFHSKRSRSHSRFFYLILCTVLVCPMLLFTGCGNITDADTSTTGNQPISISSIKLNTAVQITIYDSQDKALLDDCLALCDKYELIFSRQQPACRCRRWRASCRSGRDLRRPESGWTHRCGHGGQQCGRRTGTCSRTHASAGRTQA